MNAASPTNGKTSFTGRPRGRIPGTGEQNPTENFLSNIQEVAGSQNLISGHVSFNVITSGGAPGGKPWSVTSITWSSSWGAPAMYASQSVPNPFAGVNTWNNPPYLLAQQNGKTSISFNWGEFTGRETITATVVVTKQGGDR